jgi:ArsR family transcriptional regulator
VLGPEGNMMVVEFAKHSYEPMRSEYGDQWLGFSPEELSAWLVKCGLRPEPPAAFPVNHGLMVQIITAHKQP